MFLGGFLLLLFSYTHLLELNASGILLRKRARNKKYFPFVW